MHPEEIEWLAKTMEMKVRRGTRAEVVPETMWKMSFSTAANCDRSHLQSAPPYSQEQKVHPTQIVPLHLLFLEVLGRLWAVLYIVYRHQIQ